MTDFMKNCDTENVERHLEELKQLVENQTTQIFNNELNNILNTLKSKKYENTSIYDYSNFKVDIENFKKYNQFTENWFKSYTWNELNKKTFITNFICKKHEKVVMFIKSLSGLTYFHFLSTHGKYFIFKFENSSVHNLHYIDYNFKIPKNVLDMFFNIEIVLNSVPISGYQRRFNDGKVEKSHLNIFDDYLKELKSEMESPQLTPYGEEILENNKKLVKEQENLKSEILELKKDLSGMRRTQLLSESLNIQNMELSQKIKCQNEIIDNLKLQLSKCIHPPTSNYPVTEDKT
jgi:uncharacterized tellurite resistance protein B-like protein